MVFNRSSLVNCNFWDNNYSSGEKMEISTIERNKVHFKSVQIEGLDVFYREAGPVDAPMILLLHGFPTSSHMFRDLIPKLSNK